MSETSQEVQEGSMTEIKVHKISAMLPMSEEALLEAREDAESFHRWMNATPEQRAQWAREAAEQRAAERASAPHAAFSLDALLDKLGWSRQYAEHLVQPYCTCYDGYEGWDYCQHAQDLGLVP